MNPFIANTEEDVKKMLEAIGVSSIDDLFKDIQENQKCKSFDLPEGKSEFEVYENIKRIAGKNVSELVPFVGGGYYDHYVPAAVSSLISRGEFFTAYTPYQPECSQGTLQALYEFQSMICALTDMDVSNASLYDGGTAVYEAAMMAIRITKRSKIIMDGGVSPIFRKIVSSYTSNLDYDLVETPVSHGQADREAIKKLLDKDTAAIVLQNPNFFGAIDDFTDIVKMAHELGILVILSVYPISLGVLKTPGEMGVDIVTGEGQCLGLSLNFGGPYLGFMAAKKEFIRKMPGRIVGQTVDRDGKRCYVNTLQAREQHIRREKATSNICTNVSLCALQALIFMSLIGKQGLIDLAQTSYEKAEYAKDKINALPGVEVKQTSATFNEFTVYLPTNASVVVEKMIDKGIAAGFPLGQYYSDMDQYMIVAVTEKRTKEEIDQYVQCLSEVLNGTHIREESEGQTRISSSKV